ncbi:MAG: hypothetical protein ACXWPS_21935 [Ktedonobacteraceae bacterium]
MPYQNKPSSTPLPSQQEVQTTMGKPRFAQIRGWLRSRTGRIVIPLITLLVGVVIGVAALFLFGETGGGPIVIVPGSAKDDIIVEADKIFITQLVTKNLTSSGMPGQIQNVNVNLKEGGQMIVSGEDVLQIFGVQVNRPFTFDVQLYVRSCFLKIHIVHADFSNIPVTSFAQSFESQINQQLQQKPEGLPSGFQYCTTGVRTETTGIFVTYEAIPV